MDHNIQIVLADASEEFRRVLALTLVEEPGMQLVGDTGDGEEAVRLVGELQPDVLVMDVVLARMDGLEVLRAEGYGPAPPRAGALRLCAGQYR